MDKLSLIGLVTLAFACGDNRGPDPASDVDPALVGDLGSEVRNVDSPQVFAPHIEVIPTTIHDELGDQIDFSTGVPIHDHQGDVVVLDGSDAAPTVHKYAYLMDDAAPTFGGEIEANPLVFQFQVTSEVPLDLAASRYVVRAENGSVLGEGSPVPGAAADVYTLELHRKGVGGIAALGTYTGVVALEVRFVDVDGSASEATVHWHHVPLAAPLQFGAAGVPGIPGGMPGHDRALHSLGLSDPELRLVGTNAIGSTVYGETPGVSVGDSEVFNPTAEQVVLSVDLTATPRIHVRRSFHVDNARGPDTVETHISPCIPVPFYGRHPDCYPAELDRLNEVYDSGVIDQPGVAPPWGIRVVALDGPGAGAEVTGSHGVTRYQFVLAGRTHYRISTELGHELGLRVLKAEDAQHPEAPYAHDDPQFLPIYYEPLVAGVQITGPSWFDYGGCIEFSSDGNSCTKLSHIFAYRAITYAEISLEAELVTTYGTGVTRSEAPTTQHTLVIAPEEFGTWSSAATELPPSFTP